MRDIELTLEILKQIQDAAHKVVQRFQVINKPNDFYADINAETVFFTCEKKIPGLLDTIEKIIKDIEFSKSA